MAPDVATTLRLAACVIRERGWTTGANVDADGCVCMYGALGVAVTGDPERFGTGVVREHWDECQLALVRHLDTGLVSYWNDAPGRTVEEVLAAFEAAALAQEGKEHGEATGDPGGQGPDH